MAWIPVERTQILPIPAQVTVDSPAGVPLRLLAIDLTADPTMIAYITARGTIGLSRAMYFTLWKT